MQELEAVEGIVLEVHSGGLWGMGRRFVSLGTRRLTGGLQKGLGEK